MKSLRTLPPAAFVVLALLAACFGTGTASGQDSKVRSDNWDKLKSLTPGQQIRIVTNDVRSYEGGFESLTNEAITLRLASGEQTLAREDILRISEAGRNPQGRNMLLGTAVGAGAGLVIGAAINNRIWDNVNCTEGPAFHCSGPPNPHWGIILSAAGGLGGVIIGGRVPTGGWHDLYRARR